MKATSPREPLSGVCALMPEKKHKVTFLFSRFSLTKSAAKVIKESFPLSLKSLPCRLAATRANKVPRPSRYSIATATGSKRLSADSDSLLCHVRLWRTSRELTDSRKRTRSASPRQGGLILGACLSANITRWGLFRQYTVVTPHPSR